MGYEVGRGGDTVGRGGDWPFTVGPLEAFGIRVGLGEMARAGSVRVLLAIVLDS